MNRKLDTTYRPPPSKDEIRRQCLMIQKTWTRKERQRRCVMPATTWAPPVQSWSQLETVAGELDYESI